MKTNFYGFISLKRRLSSYGILPVCNHKQFPCNTHGESAAKECNEDKTLHRSFVMKFIIQIITSSSNTISIITGSSSEKSGAHDVATRRFGFAARAKRSFKSRRRTGGVGLPSACDPLTISRLYFRF